MISPTDITGSLLAGGRGNRMGGADKGLQPFRGRPLVEWTLERLRPQVGQILISANRNLERYGEYGVPVVQDELPDYPGPLAGLLAAMSFAETSWIATSPCDSPYVPEHMVGHLAQALEESGALLAAVRTPDGPQPVFMLCNVKLKDCLRDYLLSGGRRLQGWLGDQGAVWVDFPESRAFANFNTLADLEQGT